MEEHQYADERVSDAQHGDRCCRNLVNSSERVILVQLVQNGHEYVLTHRSVAWV